MLVCGQVQTTICLACRDAAGGFDHQYAVALEREINRREQVADAFGEARGVVDKEGAVGSERAHFGCQLLAGKSQVEEFVEGYRRVSSIATASAQACAKRNVLAKADADFAYQGIPLAHPAIATDDEVLLRRAIDHNACLLERKLRSRDYLQLIVQSEDRIEDGFQIMVTILSLAHHAQAHIDFAIRR